MIRARLLEQLGEALMLVACYLVLCLCGWALDHVLVDAEMEPAL